MNYRKIVAAGVDRAMLALQTNRGVDFRDGYMTEESARRVFAVALSALRADYHGYEGEFGGFIDDVISAIESQGNEPTDEDRYGTLGQG